MAHAEICPVCGGSGKLKKKQCHGCNGLGWVTVGIEVVSYPIVPYISPWQESPHWGSTTTIYSDHNIQSSYTQ